MSQAYVKLKAYTKYNFQKNRDPIENSQLMISFIQKMVGINDVFGSGSKRITILSVLCTIIFYGSFVYLGTFSQLVHLVDVFGDKIELFKAINCLSATSVPMSMYFFMWTSSNQLKSIIAMCRQGMSQLPASSSQSAFNASLRKGNIMAWLVIANQFVVHTVYLAVPFVMTMFGEKRYLPITPGDMYGLTPKYVSPNFEVTFIITIFATYFSAINQTGYIVLFVTVLSQELGHFYAISETLTILYKDLKTGFETEERQDQHVEKNLLFCVRHHQFIAKLHMQVKDLYRGIFMAHFIMMTAVLVTTLQTINDWDFRNTLLTGITGILPLFIYCFGGELIITACEDMAAVLYACGWERMRPKDARVVLLMLRMAQKPLQLTAADIFLMNRDTFGNVAQIVYKVYTVFN